MTRHFYTHLIEVESLVIELDKLDLSEEEKKHLAELADSTLHHTILDAILSELNEQDKQFFLELAAKGDHEKVWEFLNTKVDGVEDKIKKAAEDLKKQLHEDIKESHKLESK